MANFHLNLPTWGSEALVLPLVNIFGSAFEKLKCLTEFRCSDPQETIMHALVTCPFAIRVWFISDFNINTQFFQNKSFLDWLLFWLTDHQSKLSKDNQCLFVAILWSLWTSRNNFIFQGSRENFTAVLARARAMLLTRNSRNPSLTTPSTIHVSISDKWMPPSFGWIKCNIDGAFDDISGVNGAGYVMRDFSRKATFCASLVFDVQSAEEAEARAIWAVLKKAVEQHLSHIIVESDAKALIDQFSSGNFDGDSRTDAIFKDILFFSSKLSACIFSFQPRSCNSVAHELAQWEKQNNSSMYWSKPPVWIFPTVEEDH
ncbi:uncharacterized protein LOC113341562 [Papaver somniferum]|uniref:uncharacterized protein LOC113341562 n=1 Tax=Papaver somniferum TaxID=3469 RepID=UPI000E6FEABE|nr:uncharacterized protein LOC113341562 [Papaver somniferum]